MVISFMLYMFLSGRSRSMDMWRALHYEGDDADANVVHQPDCDSCQNSFSKAFSTEVLFELFF
jgi:hypothetical protein